MCRAYMFLKIVFVSVLCTYSAYSWRLRHTTLSMIINARGGGESASVPSDVADCEGGVCSIDNNNKKSSAMEMVTSAENDKKVSTIVDLGYSEADAKRALEEKLGSVEEAIDLLSEEEERQEQ